MQLKTLFDHLWQQYIQENPEALAIYNLFKQYGEVLENDHIAFRTFNDSRINVAKIAKFFEELGYKECGEYHFSEKKLFAKHYEHTSDTHQPKIFISELKSEEFSPFLQQQAKLCIDAINVNSFNNVELLYSGRCWGEPDYEVYQKLLAESEYAAWLYIFGFRANHFTLCVNKFKQFTSIEAVNDLLKQHNYRLNAAGGEIKGTLDDLLEQSSTMANRIMVQFKQGQFAVLNTYYEFAKRYPKKDGSLYQGFVTASADKIFESTNIIK